MTEVTAVSSEAVPPIASGVVVVAKVGFVVGVVMVTVGGVLSPVLVTVIEALPWLRLLSTAVTVMKFGPASRGTGRAEVFQLGGLSPATPK